MKQEKNQRKEQKKKIKDLLEKKQEARIQTKEMNLISKREEQDPIGKAETRLIKKLNKSPKGNPNIPNTPSNIIDVTNIEKIYVTGITTYQAIKTASFSIKRGDIVVIIGRSGSGKSTLLNLISGLDRPTKGDIVINNINISALKNNELTTFRRNNVGFIFQSYNLLPSLNARDNAEIGATLQKDGNKRIPVEEIFEKIGMKEFMDKNIKNLSGGQQQRVSIARALAKNPEIIFADEPTGALDTETSKRIIELLIDINKRYKTTIVLVTHDNTLVNVANKIIEVQDGKIKER